MNLVEVVMRLLRDQPWLWLVLVAWIVGVIGNVARKQRDEREQRDQQSSRRAEPDGDEEESGRREEARPEPRTAKSESEIAREMRRILGIEEPPAPIPAPPPPPPLPPKPRRVVVESERPPVPVAPTTSARALPIHVDSHVGDTIGKRATVGSGRVGEHAVGKELGSLGGRAPHRQHRGLRDQRYALDDLKRILVLNEILGPPLALRPDRRD